ncbi:hypothetical protein HK100_007839, partial [Physocladia obscura]
MEEETGSSQCSAPHAQQSLSQRPPRVHPLVAVGNYSDNSLSTNALKITYRNGHGNLKRTFLLSRSDAELWDTIDRWRAEIFAKRPPPQTVRKLTETAGPSRRVSQRPSLFNFLNSGAAVPHQQQQHHQEENLNETEVDKPKIPSLDLAFNDFSETPYSDAVLQAFFSSYDSDSDSDSEIDVNDETSFESLSGIVSRRLSVDSFVISVGDSKNGGPSQLTALKSKSNIPHPPVLQPNINIWRPYKYKEFRPPRSHSKLTWDMVITYSISEPDSFIVKKFTENNRHEQWNIRNRGDKDLKIQVFEKITARREQFLAKLLNMRMVIMVQQGKLKHERILKILCPFETMAAEAEAIELKKTLKSGLVKLTSKFESDLVSVENNDVQSNHGHVDAISDEPTHPYLLYKTQKTLDSFYSLFGPPDVDADKHSDIFRVKFLKNFEGGYEICLPAVKSLLTRKTISVPTLIESGCLTDYFPQHDSHYNIPPLDSPSRQKYHVCVRYHLYQSFISSWKNPVSFISWNPSEEFRFYYGEKIAMYVAWFCFYTKFLWFPTVFGITTFCYGLYEASKNFTTYGNGLLVTFDNSMTPFFAVSISIWATISLEFWGRHQITLAHIWNVSGFQRGEQIRPQWRYSRKLTKENPITQINEPIDRFPTVRRLGTLLLVVICIAINCAIVGAVIIFRAWATATWSGGILSVTSAETYAIFEWLAKILTNFDNYRTESGFQDGVVKAVLSVGSSGSDVIVGRYNASCETFLGTQSCMIELMMQMVVTFTGILFSNMLKDFVVPRVLS